MNADQESPVTRGLSASSDARQILAQWLRITQARKTQTLDYREMLTKRYPSGLINEAEMDALLGILDS